MIGANTIHPLQIEDARDAAFRASELQRAVEDDLRRESGQLAEKERLYRKALASKIVALRAGEDKVAWSTGADIARGDPHVADLKFARDVQEGVVEAVRQQAYRRAADRRDLDTLLGWSMRRDLRTDTPPVGFDRPTPEPVA